MTDEPSPRPWHVMRFSVEDEPDRIIDANGDEVAIELLEADAALIVDAVNERDRLRDELTSKAQNYEDVIAHHTRTEESLRDLVRRFADYAETYHALGVQGKSLVAEARAAIVEDAR